MDRLQEAIDKARLTRNGSVTDTTLLAPAVRSALPVTLMRSGTDPWPALRPFVPDAARLRQRRVLTLEGGPDSAPFDQLRTKAIQSMRANGWRRLGITSATAGCGKSTVALNLAFSLGRNAATRVIMAELDLRAPSLADMLGTTPADDVAAVLEGTLPFAEQALCHQGNLAFALCTGSARPPADLLHRPTVAQRLAEIETRYRPDVMIFDLPPMLASDDTMAFAAQVDCVLLIAAAEATTVNEVDHCERELSRQTNVMGVVLNKCRSRLDA